MTEFPKVSYIFQTKEENQTWSLAACHNEMKGFFEATLQLPGAVPTEEITIQDGGIAPVSAFVVVDTEGQAPSDDLESIETKNTHDGMLLALRAADSARTIKLKKNYGINSIDIDGDRLLPADGYTWLCLRREGARWRYTQQVRLSDAVDSPDSQTAASSKAVKAAYDKAMEVQKALPKTATTETAGLAPRLATNTEVEKRTGTGLVAASQLPAPVAAHFLCEFYFFRHPVLRPGFQPAQGGLLGNAATRYPDTWAYLQTEEGKMLCKTEDEWQAMTRAVWHTCADGTKIGWNGIGGAPFYAPNWNTGDLRLPDLRGMYAEAAGFDSLSVGGVHGDGIRNIWATFEAMHNMAAGACYYVNDVALHNMPGGIRGYVVTCVGFNPARMVPTANKNQPRAWGALACVYLGAPK